MPEFEVAGVSMEDEQSDWQTHPYSFSGLAQLVKRLRKQLPWSMSLDITMLDSGLH
jgi:hypothetical protein